MNTQTIIIVAIALAVAGVGLAKCSQLRRAFIVPEMMPFITPPLMCETRRRALRNR